MRNTKKTFYVYILASKKNGTLYTGLTGNLVRRTIEHKTNNKKGFTQKYGVKLLVYYETSEYVLNAINREKQIKKWSRKKKIELIESMNPEWLDLSIDMIDEEDIEELSIEIDKAYKGEGNLDSDIQRNSIRS
jgi:putative endonuclease